jgi:hypothetical protein
MRADGKRLGIRAPGALCLAAATLALLSSCGPSTENTDAQWPSISSDGRWVAFGSQATNLVPGDTNNSYDVYVHDRFNGVTDRVSIASDGSQANGDSLTPSISADGRYVAFFSGATNLVTDPTSQFGVFVHGPGAHYLSLRQTLTVSLDGTGSGTVASNPSGIDCGTTCLVIFADGTEVTLHANALHAKRAPRSVFTGWSGDCTGTGTCTVILDRAYKVTATFELLSSHRTKPPSKPGRPSAR